jgi:hypothetical protein
LNLLGHSLLWQSRVLPWQSLLTSVIVSCAMIVKVLGALDLACVIAILFAAAFPQKLILLFAIYLMGKGGIFALSGDVVSYIDVVCGIYMLLLAFGMVNLVVSGIFAAYLGQKSIFSLL